MTGHFARFPAMSDDSALGSLPAGLPPGRLVIPNPDFGDEAWPDRHVMWVSDEPLPAAGEHWKRLYDLRETTGLYPLLLDTVDGEPGRPWHYGELDPAPVGAIDVLTADGVLRRFWDSVTEENPGSADLLGLPDGPWPGLALPGTTFQEPDAAARKLADSLSAERPWLLGLVPATRGADTLALCGWDGPCNHTGHIQEISAVLRSWEERFGARVVAVGFATLDLSVAAPPITVEQGLRLAAEHFAFCPDNIWQGGQTFAEYAQDQVDATRWSFWWD